MINLKCMLQTWHRNGASTSISTWKWCTMIMHLQPFTCHMEILLIRHNCQLCNHGGNQWHNTKTHFTSTKSKKTHFVTTTKFLQTYIAKFYQTLPEKMSLSGVRAKNVTLSVPRLRKIINVAWCFFMVFLPYPSTTKYPRTSWQLQVVGRVLDVIYLSLCCLITFLPIIWGKIKGVKM